MSVILAAAFGYLLGSVPFGLVAARLFGLPDPRSIGSGNIGATNVLRTGHKGAALLTLLGDALKGAVAVWIAGLVFGSDEARAAAGMAAFIGHCFPVWLRFSGGKGVATFLGTFLALHFPTFLALCATWLAAAAVTRLSSAGALAASALAPVWLWMLGRGELWWAAAAMAVVLWWRHRENIARIARGEESRISFGRKGR